MPSMMSTWREISSKVVTASFSPGCPCAGWVGRKSSLGLSSQQSSCLTSTGTDTELGRRRGSRTWTRNHHHLEQLRSPDKGLEEEEEDDDDGAAASHRHPDSALTQICVTMFDVPVTGAGAPPAPRQEGHYWGVSVALLGLRRTATESTLPGPLGPPHPESTHPSSSPHALAGYEEI